MLIWIAYDVVTNKVFIYISCLIFADNSRRCPMGVAQYSFVEVFIAASQNSGCLFRTIYDTFKTYPNLINQISL